MMVELSNQTSTNMSQMTSPRRRSSGPLPSPSSTTSKMVFEVPPLRREPSGNSLQLLSKPPSFISSSSSSSRDPTANKSIFEENESLLPLSLRHRQKKQDNHYQMRHLSIAQRCQIGFEAMPSVVIAVILNLMICVPFGLSFFPVEWKEMPAPRAIGIQMFLLTTAICQFVFVSKSNFKCAIGMMMVENVPFMHALSLGIIQELGPTNPKTLPTIMFVYALSSVVVGVLFFALGYFKMGSIIYLFPKHIIVGAIGGIGAFVLQSGIENATGEPFEWTLLGLKSLVDPKIVWLWSSSAILAMLLSLLTRWIKSPLFPPFYFVSIPPVFYMVLLVCGIPFEHARANGWFFDRAPQIEFYAIWEQFHFDSIAWNVIPHQIGTLAGLSVFSLMHVPINIPSLSLTTDMEVDINEELKAHGISNTLGGLVGSVQNYLCYSTSALYYKCGGGGSTSGKTTGTVSGYVIGIVMLLFFLIGPNVVSLIPRCMAGCLMIHIGLDLLKEALIDTYEELDKLELLSVWIIAMTMTFWGMNQGLAIGVLLACLTFVLQSASLPTGGPLRGSMSAATLRSNKWRNAQELDVLDQQSRFVHVIQLKGHLFFGNVNQLSEYVKKLLETSNIAWKFVLLDFTLVIGLDSSAADRLTKMKHLSDVHDCRLVFAAIPSAYKSFQEHLKEIFTAAAGGSDGREKIYDTFHIAEDLNSALEWCEDGLLALNQASNPSPQSSTEPCGTNMKHLDEDECSHLRHLSRLCPDQPLSVLHRLLDYFSMEEVDKNEFLWRQGDVSDRVILLLDGQLRAIVEEEAGTTEDVSVGAFVGEICFITGEKRKTSLMATKRSVIFVLTKNQMEEMKTNDSTLAFLLQGIALRYASYRLQYVGNRIWETKCLPI